MLKRIRDHFAQKDVLEVDTPALSRYAISDINIESLEIGSSAVSRRPLFLHTSPEYCMKRLLADGYPDIYSICKVFRDGESGRRHQPEFTMIEWYRLGLGLDEIVGDAIEVIAAAMGTRRPGRDAIRCDYRQLFSDTVGVDPLHAAINDLAAIANADADLRAALGDERDAWLDLLLATRVISNFDTDRLTVLQHYPASQAALARLCPDDETVADRFEVFLGPVELANGYVELTDAAEQASRFAAELAERGRRDQPVHPVDERLLAALEVGLPACAGVAIGFERLQMVHDGTDDIGDVLTFTFDDDT